LYLEYHAAEHRSSLVILDAKEIAGEPVAVVSLPYHVPLTFHGTYKSAL
jgi:all-trans-8'-apo-beta-carotenal 15,15'-oxygenase